MKHSKTFVNVSRANHVPVYVTSENVTHVEHRRRIWRISSAGFNNKDTIYLLFVNEQAYLPYM